MSTDNLNTSDFILETVAPIFNRKGYAGTSLSDLTAATGLTKGAIYFNFKKINILETSRIIRQSQIKERCFG